LYVEEHGQAVCLDEVRGDRAVRTVEQAGKAVPLHAISTGKIFLAEKSEDGLADYIGDYGLTELTENTITDPAVLRSNLATIRERGYAFNDEETVKGLRAVACPVYQGETDELAGSLAVAGPSKWFRGSRKEEIIDHLLEAGNEVELKLTFVE
jgi:DNA-binding IclR family transcriptional regulator